MIAETYDSVVSNRPVVNTPPMELRINNYRTKRIRHRGYLLSIPATMTVSHFLDDRDEVECEVEANLHSIEVKVEDQKGKARLKNTKAVISKEPPKKYTP